MNLPPLGDDSDVYITTSKAARLLGVSQRTVHYWMDRGAIKYWKTAGGHFRIPMSSIRQLLEKRQVELLESDQPVVTILLVEDDADLREVASAVVANWNWPIRLVSAENGFEGLIQAGIHKPAVIITDLMMPSMDGFQMIKSLQSTPDLNMPRIVVMTGMDDAQIAANGGIPADVEVLHKPIPYDRLKEIVLDVLRNHSRGKYAVTRLKT
ncbi:MAG: response regulator [Magnetococcales bacterium]|nr:response regulator [Magnetococcales bacterium]MBF0113448.1 response regulator [Magnetococcales bacterium]